GRQPGDGGGQSAVILPADHAGDRQDVGHPGPGGGQGDLAADVAGGRVLVAAAEGGEFVEEDGPEPGSQVGQGLATELVAGFVGGGQGFLDHVGRPALGPQPGREFGVGNGQEEPAGGVEGVVERIRGGG